MWLPQTCHEFPTTSTYIANLHDVLLTASIDFIFGHLGTKGLQGKTA